MSDHDPHVTEQPRIREQPRIEEHLVYALLALPIFAVSILIIVLIATFGTIGGAIIGTLLFQAGVWIGRRVWSVIEQPRRGRVLAFVIIFGVAYPAVTGVIDLWLRAHVA